jgi:hypothetical protein
MSTVVKTKWPRDRWKLFPIGILGVTAFLMIWLNACSSISRGTANSNRAVVETRNASGPPVSTSPVNTSEESVPTSLADAGEYGENIYDYAKANDWKNANVKLAALRDADEKVRAEVKNQSAAIDRLDENVTALDSAVTARDKLSAMREANQVTLDVANMTTAYKLSVPVEVTKLDYDGRELEVWAHAQDANKLQATARELRRDWNALRPSVEARSAAEAKKFDALVTRVESAKTPADYSREATLVLNEVDNLEKLFH